MTNEEIGQLLDRAIEEITSLHQRVALLEPKAAAYEDISALLRMTSQRVSFGAGESVLWRLRKEREELRNEPVANPADELTLGEDD
jgi:hypothetical protein